MKREASYKEKGICVLCGWNYTDLGHNAEPVAKGRCCDLCNKTKVIPARLRKLV